MDLNTDNHPIEIAAELIAAGIFAGAVAFPASALPGVFGMLAPAVVFLLAYAALRSIPRDRAPFSLPPFELVPIESYQIGELVLDDVLAGAGPDSRVVQLFKPGAMPTAGELKASIDRHLRFGQPAAPADASEALSVALDQLRRSLH